MKLKLKKIFKWTGITFVVLIALLIAIPYLFKGKIMAKVKEELNKQLNAKVDFEDVDISLIRRFPRLAVALVDFHVTGLAPFEGDTLIAVHRVEAAMDLMSAIKGDNIKVYSVLVKNPRIHAIVNPDGRVNWDIMKPDTTTATEPEKTDTASGEFALSLQQYAIEDAYITYADRQGNMTLQIDDLDHSGKGDFTQDVFTLKTKTNIGGISFLSGLIPYLHNVKAGMDADVNIDNKTSTYSFKTDKIAINNLQLATEGFFRLLTDSTYGMDIQFKAPSTDFKDILSLVPSVFAADLAKIKTSGSTAFSGYVKGEYTPAMMPGFGINLSIKNGFVQYPDLPKPIKNIQLVVDVTNPDGVPDHTVVNMPQAHLEMDNAPVDMRLLLKTPVSDLYVDAAAKAKLDLSTVNQFYKLEPGTKLAGLLDADIAAKGNLSAIEKSQYEKFDAQGAIILKNMLYSSKDYPDGVKVSDLLMQFTPKNLSVKQFAGQYLGTNFNATGEVNNALAYVLKNDPLNGHLDLAADYINLDKWMATGEPTAAKPAAADTVKTASEPFVVPGNLDFNITAKAGKVHYDKLDLTNLSGNLRIADQAVQLDHVKGNALQGAMDISGSYSTKNSKKNPEIALTYDVKELDIQQTFLAFNTVQKLMPIAQFLGGKISSKLTVNGKLGEDMSPVLNSLNGEGNLLLIQGVLKKFAPLDQLANQLNIAALQDISVRDIKNYIAFQNGRVTVNPFRVKLGNMNMLVGGSHGFDQTLDYTLQIALPRSVIGAKGTSLIDNMVSQANNKGIPVKLSDSVHLQVAMGGSITRPSMKTDLQESVSGVATNLKNQATAIVKAKVDSAKAVARDTLNSVKNQAVNALKDEVKNQLLGKKDSTTSGGNLQNAGKAATNSLKGALNGLVKKKSNNTDSTKNQ
ncbi:hypothetical protein MKQ68_15780 [Chitinophaga horti]|uniref:Uncharacterized protein n=1 Tax=Chitinophaga horti TaxID=2920382 RepID=A0ABY6IW10_9BACT|nr:AsmA-like C-terminal region-containing protein [Chitinophaga horti]UYQ91551.1 hypothetical protein MKQ68_15780 [Chitinophaga horti]